MIKQQAEIKVKGFYLSMNRQHKTIEPGPDQTELKLELLVN